MLGEKFLTYKVLASGNQVNSSCWSCMHVIVPSHEEETGRNREVMANGVMADGVGRRSRHSHPIVLPLK